MQILLYPYYFTRSILLRGLFNSIKLLKGELSEERKFGIETMAIKKSKSREFFHYQGAGYLVLFRIFESLRKYKDFAFIDIGSGKGRVIFVAEHSGFSELTGIELDKTLVEQARNNEKLYKKRSTDSRILFVHRNALEYLYNDKPAVYFFFNPFNEEIMDRVLERICTTVQSECIFVYMNPLYQKPFIKRKLEVLTRIKTRWYVEAVIYRKAQLKIT